MRKLLFLCLFCLILSSCATTERQSGSFLADFIKVIAQAANGFDNSYYSLEKPAVDKKDNGIENIFRLSPFFRPLFDSQGQVRYFLEKNGRVINLDGRSIAWIDANGNVYNYRGKHQGWFENGYIRGHDGGVVVWQQGTQGLGVIPPIPKIQPIPPIPEIEHIRPIPSIPPIKPIPRWGWSNYGLE